MMRKKQRKRKRIRNTILCIMALAGLLLGLYLFLGHYSGFTVAADPVVNEDFSVQSLSSPYVYLMRRSDQKELMGSREQEKIYPASMTKIMTVLLGVEYMPDLDSWYQLPPDFSSLYAQDASMAGFSPGEQVRTGDLLYGAMLPSGADACLGIASYVSGSESAFVDLMNKKAGELGLEHTHFANSDGLHDTQHYSTVEDMARLLDHALDNADFYAVFTTKSYDTRPTDLHPQGIHLTSTLFGTGVDTTIPQGELLGGKTGYTEKAGLCLASLAEKNGVQYILVTAKASGSHETEPLHIQDALQVYQNCLR